MAGATANAIEKKEALVIYYPKEFFPIMLRGLVASGN